MVCGFLLGAVGCPRTAVALLKHNLAKVQAVRLSVCFSVCHRGSPDPSMSLLVPETKKPFWTRGETLEIDRSFGRSGDDDGAWIK